MLEINPGPR